MREWSERNEQRINSTISEVLQWATELMKDTRLYNNLQERMEFLASAFHSSNSPVVIQFLLMNQFSLSGFLSEVGRVIEFFSTFTFQTAFYPSSSSIRSLPTECLVQLLREGCCVCS